MPRSLSKALDAFWMDHHAVDTAWYDAPDAAFYMRGLTAPYHRKVPTHRRVQLETFLMPNSELEEHAIRLLLCAAQEHDFMPFPQVVEWFKERDMPFHGLLRLPGEPLMAVTDPERLGVCVKVVPHMGDPAGYVRAGLLVNNTQGVVFVGPPRRKTFWSRLLSDTEAL